jgi:queuine tRNA-ribosyltransferase
LRCSATARGRALGGWCAAWGLGGLHAFMGWDGPILTDSGGYQVYSLARHCERTEDGMSFCRPSDGVPVLLSPERCIAIQEALGAELVVSLDEFEPIADTLDAAVSRKARWGAWKLRGSGTNLARQVHRRGATCGGIYAI